MKRFVTQQRSHTSHPSKCPTGEPTHRNVPPKTEKLIISSPPPLVAAALHGRTARGIAFTVPLPPEFE